LRRPGRKELAHPLAVRLGKILVVIDSGIPSEIVSKISFSGCARDGSRGRRLSVLWSIITPPLIMVGIMREPSLRYNRGRSLKTMGKSLSESTCPSATLIILLRTGQDMRILAPRHARDRNAGGPWQMRVEFLS
jgi:hypothetical protein